jgi:HEAT repeat protein
MYGLRADSIPEIRTGLLEIAAYAAPEETRPILVELVSTYGDELFVRAQAASFLAATSPETALEVLTPVLTGEARGTFPPEDQLLEAWNSAALSTGADRTPLLCDIATDPKRDQAVRHLATKLLGGLPGEQGRQALELLLVESSGNQYIRRLAAQSLVSTLSAEDLCALLRTVIAREADPNFQIFLDSIVQQNCQ